MGQEFGYRNRVRHDHRGPYGEMMAFNPDKEGAIRGRKTGIDARPLDAEIGFANILIDHEFIRGVRHDNPTIFHDIAPVGRF